MTKLKVPPSLKILNLNSCGPGLTGDVSQFSLHEGLVELALDKSGVTGDLAKMAIPRSLKQLSLYRVTSINVPEGAPTGDSFFFDAAALNELRAWQETQ